MNRCQVRFEPYERAIVAKPKLTITFTRLAGAWTLHGPSGETERISPTMWAKRQGLSGHVIAQTQLFENEPVSISD